MATPWSSSTTVPTVVHHEKLEQRDPQTGSLRSVIIDRYTPSVETRTLKSGVNHSNFHSRAQRGEVMFGPLMNETEIFEYSLASQDYYEPPHEDSDGDLIPNTGFHTVGTRSAADILSGILWPSFDVPDEEELIAQAVLDANANASITDFSLLTNLLEMKGSIQLVADNLKRGISIGRFVISARKAYMKRGPGKSFARWYRNNYRRYTRRAPRNPVSTWADLWLEVQFGWKPMIGDALKLARLVTDGPSFSAGQRQTFRGGPTSDQANSFASGTDTSRFSGIDFDYRWTATSYASCVANLLCQVIVDGPALWAGALGAGDTAEELYNGVPFSWFLDYFSNFGKLIAAFEPDPGLKKLGGSSFTRAFSVVHIEAFNFRPRPGTYDTDYPRVINMGPVWAYRRYHRSQRRTDVSPEFKVRLDYDFVFDVNKMSNLVAVADGIRRGLSFYVR